MPTIADESPFTTYGRLSVGRYGWCSREKSQDVRGIRGFLDICLDAEAAVCILGNKLGLMPKWERGLLSGCDWGRDDLVRVCLAWRLGNAGFTGPERVVGFDSSVRNRPNFVVSRAENGGGAGN